MDEIFSLYQKVEDPDFIGQDDVANQILSLSKKVEQEEYDQQRQTKYYQIIRWTIEHLSQKYRENNDLKSYFNLISQIKEIKNTNNTFLVKLTDKLIAKLKKRKDLLNDIVNIAEEITKFCDETNNISMKSKIQTRLAEVYYIHENYSKALDICNKVIFDLKRYEDNLGLIQLLLLESKIYYATNGISKAKASLTSVKTLITKVYVEPKLQANIDMHAGILAAYEKDFNLAYSYFFEAFDVYNIPSKKRRNKGLRAFEYMILCKIVGGHIEEVNNVVLSKQGKDYYGPEVEALRSIESAVKEKSIKLLEDNIAKNKKYFTDRVINYHISNLHNDLLEKNLIKIIKPYSVVEIDFVAKSIGLNYQDVLNRLRQMILDKKINGILDQGKGSLIIYDVDSANPYLDKSIETFKNLEKVVEALDKKVRATNI
jgi:26S proteasome regulatory subunit N6